MDDEELRAIKKRPRCLWKIHHGLIVNSHRNMNVPLVSTCYVSVHCSYITVIIACKIMMGCHLPALIPNNDLKLRDHPLVWVTNGLAADNHQWNQGKRWCSCGVGIGLLFSDGSCCDLVPRPTLNDYIHRSWPYDDPPKLATRDATVYIFPVPWHHGCYSRQSASESGQLARELHPDVPETGNEAGSLPVVG